MNEVRQSDKTTGSGAVLNHSHVSELNDILPLPLVGIGVHAHTEHSSGNRCAELISLALLHDIICGLDDHGECYAACQLTHLIWPPEEVLASDRRYGQRCQRGQLGLPEASEILGLLPRLMLGALGSLRMSVETILAHLSEQSSPLLQ